MRTEQDHVFKAEHTGPSTSRCLVNTHFFGSPRSGSPSDDHLAALQSFNCNERFELHEPEASAQAGTLRLSKMPWSWDTLPFGARLKYGQVMGGSPFCHTLVGLISP